jgi:hypothetical protein
MADGIYPAATQEVYNRRKELTPHSTLALDQLAK